MAAIVAVNYQSLIIFIILKVIFEDRCTYYREVCLCTHLCKCFMTLLMILK